jgi:hypothetical protein
MIPGTASSLLQYFNRPYHHVIMDNRHSQQGLIILIINSNQLW